MEQTRDRTQERGATSAALSAARVANVLGGTTRNREIPRSRLADKLQQNAASDSALALERRIRAHLSRGRVEVQLTDNRYTMISVRRHTEGAVRYTVRLHHMFADSGPEVTQALARYIVKNDRRASRMLGQFIDANQHRVRDQRPRGRTLQTQGDCHDLAAIYDRLNEQYFANRIDAAITWGQRTGKPRRRSSIKMGSYSVEDRLIRIHRSLDREFVPEFFVAWVVFHEMLHQVHGAPVVNGRRQFHSKEFLEDEANYERYAEARAWERSHIEELLHY